MLNDEIAQCLARFFDSRHGPSHDRLTEEFRRKGLLAGDPRQGATDPIGKAKRVHRVLTYAIDNNQNAGDELAVSLLALLRAEGAFRTESAATYAGEETIRAAREAFKRQGYDLDPEGNLRPSQLENLEGVQANEALWTYVRRARVGSDDAALVVGTGKDLLEATARHVLVEKTGAYPTHDNFPATLYQAFDRLGLASSTEMLTMLDTDPRRAMQQGLYVLANAVNRLRNAEGTGHGRPFLPVLTDSEARAAVQAMGLISQMLLDASRIS